MILRLMSKVHTLLILEGHPYQYNLEPLCPCMRNRVLAPCTQKAIHFQNSLNLFYLLTQDGLKKLQQSVQVLS